MYSYVNAILSEWKICLISFIPQWEIEYINISVSIKIYYFYLKWEKKENEDTACMHTLVGHKWRPKKRQNAAAAAKVHFVKPVNQRQSIISCYLFNLFSTKKVFYFYYFPHILFFIVWPFFEALAALTSFSWSTPRIIRLKRKVYVHTRCAQTAICFPSNSVNRRSIKIRGKLRKRDKH